MNIRNMTHINPGLREEINLKLQKIARHPRYYDKRKELVVQEIRSLGDIYSFWIENPELRKALLLENKKPETIRKMAREGIQAVHNGWYYLSQQGQFGNFTDYLSTDLLQRLNGLVARKDRRSGYFREPPNLLSHTSGDVTLNLEGYTPPSWEKVPAQVKELLEKIRESYKTDPLEAAILAHLGIGAIQPFFDGNKRCSRLIQNRILYDAQMPPATIQAGESKFYFGLLKKAFPAFRDGGVEGQRQFYDYCASKVNNGLDEILGDLQEEPAIKNTNH